MSTASDTTEFSPEELAELAGELRSMWHAMVRGVQHPEPLQGLQRQQFWVLGALSHGARRMSDLAEAAQTSQASLTGIVDRLEERGLVERVRNAEDRRVVDVALTDSGRTEMARANAAMLERLNTVLAPLSAADRRELLRLARIVASHNCGPASFPACP